jgi:hypothetical protein
LTSNTEDIMVKSYVPLHILVSPFYEYSGHYATR